MAKSANSKIFVNLIKKSFTKRLWICDIFFAYQELSEWLDSDGQLVAAIALGYPNEYPDERPRRKIEDIVAWRN